MVDGPAEPDQTNGRNHLLAVLVFLPALQHLQPLGDPLHLQVFLL